jgi:hypothetical protein
VSIRATGLKWAAIGFMAPVLWGVLGFILFNARESFWTTLFWILVYITCPFWLLPESSISWLDWLDTPVLNACLYGSIAMVIVRIRRSMQRHNTSRDTDGPSNNRWRGP